MSKIDSYIEPMKTGMMQPDSKQRDYRKNYYVYKNHTNPPIVIASEIGTWQEARRIQMGSNLNLKGTYSIGRHAD